MPSSRKACFRLQSRKRHSRVPARTKASSSFGRHSPCREKTSTACALQNRRFDSRQPRVQGMLLRRIGREESGDRSGGVCLSASRQHSAAAPHLIQREQTRRCGRSLGPLEIVSGTRNAQRRVLGQSVLQQRLWCDPVIEQQNRRFHSQQKSPDGRARPSAIRSERSGWIENCGERHHGCSQRPLCDACRGRIALHDELNLFPQLSGRV